MYGVIVGFVASWLLALCTLSGLSLLFSINVLSPAKTVGLAMLYMVFFVMVIVVNALWRRKS